MKILFFEIILFFAVLLTCDAKERAVSKPNVLFIIVDDLNTTLGCYGHPVIKTPNIDKLAEKGLKFNRAYCNYAVCGPSRGSLLSGLRPESIGILDNTTPLQDVLGERPTLPFLFKQNGYHTISLGKVFHGSNEHNDMKAWDEIYGFSPTETGRKGESRNMTGGELKWCWWQAALGNDEDQPDGQLAQKAVDFILSKKEKPFFLAVGFHKPHDPFIAPEKYFDLYPVERCNPPDLPVNWKPPYSYSLPNQTSIFNQFTEQDKREFLRSYYACTSFMDAQVGKVIEALEKSGEMENTVIVFFGDHGYHLGEHNWWNKVTIYERGTNAPFIMAGKGVNGEGAETDAMIEFIDIYPTLAHLADLNTIPEHLEGRNFESVLKDPSTSFRNEVRAIVNRGSMLGKMVKNNDYRYIEWGEGTKGIELYNQWNDPVEYNNLAGDSAYAEVILEMKELLHSN